LVLTDSDGYDVIIDSTLPSGTYVLNSRSPSLSLTRSSSSSYSSTPASVTSSTHSTTQTPSIQSVSSNRLSSDHSIPAASLSGTESKFLSELKDKTAISELIDVFSHSVDSKDAKKMG